MVGGRVREVIICAKKVWVNCYDTERPNPKNDCAIYVERNEKSELISMGDSVWWQGRLAMWTPHPHKDGAPYDIRINRIGFSGVERPSLNTILGWEDEI